MVSAGIFRLGSVTTISFLRLAAGVILATQQPLESALGNPAGSSELFNKHRLTRFVPLLTFLVMRFTFNLTA